jgi:hypothetical protein
MYWDANSLYAHAMSQYLPYANLKYNNNVTLSDIMQTPDTSDIGYALEVDFYFPEEYMTN